jgi:hypothetical protein
MTKLIAILYQILDEDKYSTVQTQEFYKDLSLISSVLEEVDFLYSRGILEERKLGRLVDIIKGKIG